MDNQTNPASTGLNKGAILTPKPDPPEINAPVELIGRFEARISWDDQSKTTSKGVYEVSWWTDETDKRSIATEKNECILTKLIPGSKYFVHAKKKLGRIASDPSEVIAFKTAPNKPNEIRVKNYESSAHDSLVVYFKNGNKEQMAHRVMVQPVEGDPKEIPVPKERDFALFQSLTPGQSYSARVIAVDEDCNSKVEESDATTYGSLVQTYPSAPENLEFELLLENRLKLTWDECSIKPLCYRVYCGKNRNCFETNEAYFTIDDLKSSTTYSIFVTAVNGAGESEKCHKEIKTAPKAPTGIRVNSYEESPHDSLEIVFDNESTKGLSHIVKLKNMQGQTKEETVHEGENFVLVKGLMPGEKHSVQVQAVDKDCNGKVQTSHPATYESLAQTYPIAPDDINLELLKGNSLKVSWRKCNVKPLCYRVYCSITDDYFETTSTILAIDGLELSTTYKVHVTAVNRAGESGKSQEKEIKTAPHKPTEILVENYEPSPHDSLVVHFKNGNKEQMPHIVIVQPLEGEARKIKVPEETDFALVQDLPPGQKHIVRVRAIDENCNEEVEESDERTYESLVQTHPSPPEDLKFDHQNKKHLKLTWEKCNIKPLCYRVYCSERKKYSETFEPNFTIEDVKPSTNYKFSVTAVNQAGESEKSQEAEFKTAPATVSNLRVKSNENSPKTSFIVSYDYPSRQGIEYKVVAEPVNGEKEIEVTTSDTYVTLNGLGPGNSYHIYVVTVCGDQESEKLYFNA